MGWKVWEKNILGEMCLFLQVLVHSKVSKVLNIGWHFGQSLLQIYQTEKCVKIPLCA
jgi:hypothetical protein